MTIGFSRLIPALVLFGSLPLSGAVDLDFEKENTMLECRTGAKERIVQLEKPLSGPFTLLIRLRLNAYPAEAFTATSPGGVASLYSADGRSALELRIRGSYAELYAHGDIRQGKAADGRLRLPLKHWFELGVVWNGSRMSLFVDGIETASNRCPAQAKPFTRLIAGRGMALQRRLDGEIARVRLIEKALSREEMFADFNKNWGGSQIPWKHEKALPAYAQLKIADDAVEPITGPITQTAEVVPWSGPGTRDLLLSGQSDPTGHYFFGHQLKLHRNLNRTENGSPVFDSGEDIALSGREFKTILRKDGLFDLIAYGANTPLGGQLIYYRNSGKPGAPVFNAATPVTVGGKFYPGEIGNRSAAIWDIGDLDGDGVPDLVFSTQPHDAFLNSIPDRTPIWDGRSYRNSGPGRGYDITGNWLGRESIHYFFWARGQAAPDGLNFGKPQQIFYGTHHPETPLQVKALLFPSAPAVLNIGGERFLAIACDVDKLYCVRIKTGNGTIRAYDSHPLLASPEMPTNYIICSMRAADIDGDGREELIAGGNTGRITVYKGTKPGDFTEAAVLQQGGSLQAESLVTPARGDWNGDKYPDLITGDASGYLICWPGTADPLVYGTPRHLRENGNPVRHRAGLTGSIQGPAERQWGYLQPTLGDWDGDGRNDIITNDIKGELKLYRHAAADPYQVKSEFFTYRGQKLVTAMRSRPAIVPAKYNYTNKNMPVLLFLDFNGYLSVAIPAEKGSAKIAEIVRLTDGSGKPLSVSGVNQLWGRAKFAVTDWDGDGRWDILWGHLANAYREVWPKGTEQPRDATLCCFPNTGTNEKPHFGTLYALKKPDGNWYAFGNHNSSLFPTDLDGDGKEDLIVGAEDGKVYYLYRSQLKPVKVGEWTKH
ncbi:FG-GAP-like repeat-containing protein [Victivallis vadensis]|uniref:FG-GAP-like repeat-containing protein n=1 Tax=Victivallis vadensis TaxID=172901 RepID=UPI0023F63047|nr:FG-GAP-like repeat-containing protein [Victivallis vadensis]